MRAFLTRLFNTFTLHFYFFLRLFFAGFVTLFFRLDRNFPDRRLLYASNAVILANHTSNWDPFVLGIYLRRQICYVASDMHFRRPFVGMLLAATGAIPKIKGKSDVRNIRKIISLAKGGKTIGIFPEGQTSWDGKSIPIVKGTIKLVRMLKLPIFCFSIEGNYFSSARWMKGLRRGRIKIHLNRYLSVAEQTAMNLTELHDAINTGISTDACATQMTTKTPFSGSFPAQYLERIIYLCPACLTQESMTSYHTELRCTNCKYHITYTDTGSLLMHQKEAKPPRLFTFATGMHRSDAQDTAKSPSVISISDYLAQQRYYFETFLTQKRIPKTSAPLITSKKITLLNLRSTKPQLEITGTMHGHADRIEIISDYFENFTRSFTLKDITAFNIQKNEKAEFFYDRIGYRLEGSNLRFSMLRWLIYIHCFSPTSCVGLANG